MEESLDDLYQQFVECRKKKLKELIEVQSQLSVAEEVSHVKRAQNALEQLLADTDSSAAAAKLAAAKLSSEIRANAGFMMDVLGLGKDVLQSQNQAVLPQTQSVPQIGVIENVQFED